MATPPRRFPFAAGVALAVTPAALLLPVGGCGSEDGMPAVDPAEVECGETVEAASQTPLPADVDDVIERKCRGCHGLPLENFAPMPLVTWEHLHAPAPSSPQVPVYERVQDRIHSQRAPMPPILEPPLEAGELDLLDAWLQACAPPAQPLPEG